MRTQETVGGPNGAKRSEFRRGCLSADVAYGRCGTSKPAMGSIMTTSKSTIIRGAPTHVCKTAPFAHDNRFTCANPAILPPSCHCDVVTGANQAFLPPCIKL